VPLVLAAIGIAFLLRDAVKIIAVFVLQLPIVNNVFLDSICLIKIALLNARIIPINV
jgi:hypothetical protein